MSTGDGIKKDCVSSSNSEAVSTAGDRTASIGDSGAGGAQSRDHDGATEISKEGTTGVSGAVDGAAAEQQDGEAASGAPHDLYAAAPRDENADWGPTTSENCWEAQSVESSDRWGRFCVDEDGDAVGPGGEDYDEWDYLDSKAGAILGTLGFGPVEASPAAETQSAHLATCVVLHPPLPTACARGGANALRSFAQSCGCTRPTKAKYAYHSNNRFLGWAAVLFATPEQAGDAVTKLRASGADATMAEDWEYQHLFVKKHRRTLDTTTFLDQGTPDPPLSTTSCATVTTAPPQLTLNECLKAVPDLMAQTFFGIDFECVCAMKGGVCLPNEIGVQSFNLKERFSWFNSGTLCAPTAAPFFHCLIKQKSVPPQYLQTSIHTERHLHGIPLNCTSAEGDVRQIWTNLTTFLQSHCSRDPILFAKDCTTEKACLKWLADAIGEEDTLSKRVFELEDLVTIVLREKSITIDPTTTRRFLSIHFGCEADASRKCTWHSENSLNHAWHCALADARAIGSCIPAIVRQASELGTAAGLDPSPLDLEIMQYLKDNPPAVDDAPDWGASEWGSVVPVTDSATQEPPDDDDDNDNEESPNNTPTTEHKSEKNSGE